jgi:glutathione S-transferase
LGAYPMPNLPYLKDGPFTMTQTTAILRYIGREYDLLGKTREQSMKVDFNAILTPF